MKLAALALAALLLPLAPAAAQTLDQQPPVTTLFLAGAAGAEGWWRGPVSALLAADDEGSGVEATWFLLDAGVWTLYGDAVQVAGDGNHSLQYHSVDRAGNVEAAHVEPLRIDATAPATAIALDCAAPGEGAWCRAPWLDYEASASDATSGLAAGQTRCRLDDALVGCAGNVVREGRHLLEVEALDKAGNEGLGSITVGIDSREPSVRLEATCAEPGLGGWCRGPVQLGAEASDDTSGLASLLCSVGGDPVPCDGAVGASGIHEAHADALDIAGHAAKARAGFKVDAEGPALDLATACDLPGNNGWCRAYEATYTVAASDAHSGLAPGWPQCALDGAPAPCEGVVRGEGAHTLLVEAMDLAGNPSSGEYFLGIDTQGPVVTLAAPVFAAGDFEVWVRAEDRGSGLAGTLEVWERAVLQGYERLHYAAQASGPEQTHVVPASSSGPGPSCFRATLQDAAGNMGASLSPACVLQLL